MKIVQKFKLAGHGAQFCAGVAGIALGLGLLAVDARAQQYQSTYGSGGGSVIIDPNVLNSMGGPQVTTQGTAIIPIPGTGATLLAPPLQTPRSRLLIAGGGNAPAQTGTPPAPAQEPASRLLVAPATQTPAAPSSRSTASAPQLRQPQPAARPTPQPAPKVASVSDETPPPPQPTQLKESEPVAPEPMQTEAPSPPPRATAVKEEDKATDAAPPEAAPEPAPSPGAEPSAPAPAEDEAMAETEPKAGDDAMAAAPERPSEPELPQTPSTSRTTEPTAPAPAREPSEEAPETTQTASLPPSGAGIDERLLFEAEQDELTEEMRAQLSDIAQTLLGDEARRIELRGYADAAGGNAGAARRISLKRAVSVRRFLMDQGVRSTRIDVRALGDKDETGGPPDRVDLILSQ